MTTSTFIYGAKRRISSTCGLRRPRKQIYAHTRTDAHPLTLILTQHNAGAESPPYKEQRLQFISYLRGLIGTTEDPVRKFRPKTHASWEKVGVVVPEYILRKNTVTDIKMEKNI